MYMTKKSTVGSSEPTWISSCHDPRASKNKAHNMTPPLASSSRAEFLTDQTTCVSEMIEKTTCENFLSKRTSCGWRHPWPGDTWHVPPGPMPAPPCRCCQTRHVAVATSPVTAVWPGGPCRLPQFRQGDVAGMPPPPLPAPPCLCCTDSRPAPCRIPALIPTLTGLFFRRES
jgi:hypothetical protein